MSVQSPPTGRPVSMPEAVGYGAIDCSHQASIDEALVLKHDRLFLLLNEHGHITPPGRCGLGLFVEDTRMLSHYSLGFTGGPPSLLSSQALQAYHAQVDLALTDQDFGGDAWDPKNTVHIRRDLLLDDCLIEQVDLTNYLTTPIHLGVELLVGSDFADIFEIRGWKREQRGQFYAPAVQERGLGFHYRGRDGALLGTEIVFATPPEALTPGRALWNLQLEPGERQRLSWRVAARMMPDPDRPMSTGWTPPTGEDEFEARRARVAEIYDRWHSDCTCWTSDVAEFNTTLHKATDDLRALYTDVDGEQIISAGIPWYSTAFGRDSIITSLQTLSVNPQVATDTLRYLARHQGQKIDPYTEEQPGKIMHELRRGEMARAGEIPHVPYYGTIDATPLWLVLLHETWRWTGDASLVRDLLPAAESALRWMDEYGDLDGDGFLEYARTSDKGLVNQGWKDSGDGVPLPDGTLPEGPIALVEVQGYAYDAKWRMADLFEGLGDATRAESLRQDATRLRQRILDAYWVDETGSFALALDGQKRPVPPVTTNAAHLLWSRVPTAAQAQRLAELLCGPEMFSGWGIRTLSEEHPVFNPMSYHNGSIWPHDNALAVMGLSFYGHAADALPVLEGLHDAAVNMTGHRLPELFCGMSRGNEVRPVLYPVSCSPQAWASGAFFMLLQAVTGILPEAHAGILHIVEPQLPSFLRELTVRGLRIGDSTVALQFRRYGERTLANLLNVEGAPLQVRIELS